MDRRMFNLISLPLSQFICRESTLSLPRRREKSTLWLGRNLYVEMMKVNNVILEALSNHQQMPFIAD